MRSAIHFLSLLLLVCGQAFAADPAPDPLSGRETGRVPFKMGIIIPLSGDLAGYGSAVRNGFELARKDSPEKFTNIAWDYEDSRYDPKVAMSALAALRARQNYNLFYTWGVGPNEALIPVLESNHLPTLAETTLKARTVGKKYIIRAARTGEMLADALLGEFARRGIKNAGMLVAEIPYYQDIVDALRARGEKAGVSVHVVNSFVGTDSDFRNSIITAKKQKFDALGVFLLPDQLISFYRQSAELNYKVPTFGSDIPDSQKLIDLCESNVDGMFFPSIGMTEEFRKRYLAAFADDSFIGSGAQAYDMALLVADLFGSPGGANLSGEEVIERLSHSGPRSGATGTFQFTESAEDGKAFHMPLLMKVVIGKRISDLR